MNVSSLLAAIRAGQSYQVEHLLQNGADTEEGPPDEPLPLLEVLSTFMPFEDRMRILESLLAHGADPMWCDPDSGYNALTLAAEKDYGKQYLDMIFQYSEDKSIANEPDDRGRLPLQTCVNLASMRELIHNGADVQLVNNVGNTPLRYYQLFRPELLPVALWEGVVCPLMEDGKLDLRTLVAGNGAPTPVMELLLEYDMCPQLLDPATYRGGMDDLAVVYDYLPQSLKHRLDMSAWRNSSLDAVPPEEGTHIGRYERKKTPEKKER